MSGVAGDEKSEDDSESKSLGDEESGLQLEDVGEAREGRVDRGGRA